MAAHIHYFSDHVISIMSSHVTSPTRLSAFFAWPPKKLGSLGTRLYWQFVNYLHVKLVRVPSSLVIAKVFLLIMKFRHRDQGN